MVTPPRDFQVERREGRADDAIRRRRGPFGEEDITSLVRSFQEEEVDGMMKKERIEIGGVLYS
jgi:hypothetical protein